jgi:uncharacterized protein (TIGR02611 family)
MTAIKRHAKKTIVGIIGSLILVVGIIAIPYPGPGWLIVFAGLGILATEFTWAENLLLYLRKKYDAWQEWLHRQPRILQAFFWALTAFVVIVTIWLFNGYGLLNAWLHLNQSWLDSPLPIFN